MLMQKIHSWVSLHGGVMKQYILVYSLVCVNLSSREKKGIPFKLPPGVAYL